MKKGFLDARTLHTALCKRQPLRHMFAISGEVATGARLGTAGQTARVLGFLEQLPAAGKAAQLLDTSKGLPVWFRGPQPLGNFLAAWCANGHNPNFDIVMLYPQCTYVAVTQRQTFSPSPYQPNNNALAIQLERYASSALGVG